ncbi:MAG TPA: DUF3618 domain-containing protein [Pseudonocardiaceae bacterium]
MSEQMERTTEQERLTEEIERTRAELGRTVHALTEKADVPARVRRRGGELAGQARAAATPQRLALGGAVLALALLALIVRMVRS